MCVNLHFRLYRVGTCNYSASGRLQYCAGDVSRPIRQKSYQKRREYSFSYVPFQGAILLSLDRLEQRFNLPHQLLTLLMDMSSGSV